MLRISKKIGRVFVGLSGGVDSAVSAALLQKEGYDVTGVFIRIVVPGYPCTAGQDRIDAMRVAAHLKIPFIEVDFSKEYTKGVFKPSIKEFAKGETPNPDVLCNREIKFGKFFEFARSHGADCVATGHYAQVQDGELYAGVDTTKDQSYFLALVPQNILEQVIFPLGKMKKEEVRAYAKKIGLPNATRPDSQGLCFLGPISIREMLTREVRQKPGNAISEDGEVIGSHEGAAHYTLGQRHGFTLTNQTPDTPPHFVVAKDIKKNTITVSTSRLPRRAKRTQISLRKANWIGGAPLGPCGARFRYRQSLIPTELKKDSVVLFEPHYAPIGQSLVLYRDGRCLGGGVIENVTII